MYSELKLYIVIVIIVSCEQMLLKALINTIIDKTLILHLSCTKMLVYLHSLAGGGRQKYNGANRRTGKYCRIIIFGSDF